VSSTNFCFHSILNNVYRLIDSPDIPFPWEFTDRGFNILYYPEVTSTMDTAKDLARKNCPDFTVVLFISIGMGINVNNDPSVAEPGSSSLKKITGREISKKMLLARFLAEFEKRLRKAEFENVISKWKKYTVTLNRRVKIVTHKEVSEGLAVDVEEDGALVFCGWYPQKNCFKTLLGDYLEFLPIVFLEV
jgi:hypothetical protein